MFQQSHSWADIKRKSQFKRIHVKKKKKGYTYIDVHCSTIYNSHNMDAT